jgi:hypothetical protein
MLSMRLSIAASFEDNEVAEGSGGRRDATAIAHNGKGHEAREQVKMIVQQ